MKVLISGFEAFGGNTLNPTKTLVDELRAGRVRIPNQNSNLIVCETVLLPVGFANAFENLKVAIDRFRPDVVLSLGQAEGRDAVELERVALNLVDADIPDNLGHQPRNEKISPEGETAYLSTLPLLSMLEALKQAEIPARISNSAGFYVCNYVFYRLLREAKVERSGFVHFPYLPEQAALKQKPSMPLATMIVALETLLAALSPHD